MVRIIAGELKGRRLEVPRGASVRPTADRVREALFSILLDRTPGARVLDAYAGTGALGFEALSRGARSVLFLERDRNVVTALKANLARLELDDRCSVLAGDVVETIGRGRVRGPFELVLADPPYADGQGQVFLEAVESARLIGEGAWLVLEASSRHPAPEAPSGFLLRFRSERYGEVALHFYAGRSRP